jgi:7,8-dihydropterin-6-yl-methyl-4-(beta-D-ribofuranosyl)aminobenzene 5'-phosphate synthase
MRKGPIVLPEIDVAKVTIVVDNSIDLLIAGTEIARRPPLRHDTFSKQLIPLAEHGFSALIEVERGEKSGTILFDAALSPKCLTHNLDAMEIDLKSIQAVVLSHGHADHTFGLPGLIGRLGARNTPLVLHPDAFLERRIVLPNGDSTALPAPKLADLRKEGIEIVEEAGTSMLVDGMILVSGEVERTTEFEKGFPIHEARRNERWEKDPFVMDDQCLIINVRGKGLVIVSGCSHSGIVNTVRHAQALTGVQTIHAVIGGFHLTGPSLVSAIQPTVKALAAFQPRYVMPGHCTGWSATHQIAAAMPEAFIANSVGTTLVL